MRRLTLDETPQEPHVCGAVPMRLVPTDAGPPSGPSTPPAAPSPSETVGPASVERATDAPVRHLLVVSGGLSGKRLLLPSAGEIILGRDPDCAVAFPDQTISRRHCRILVNRSVFVRDLRSTNGTFLNGAHTFLPAALNEGDLLRLGTSTLLTLQTAAEPAAGREFLAALARWPSHDGETLRRGVVMCRIAEFSKLAAHLPGDVVEQIITTTEDHLRELVGDAGLLLRLGLEHFGILPCDGFRGQHGLAQQIREHSRTNPFHWNEGYVYVHLLAVVVPLDIGAAPPEALLRAAREAIYEKSRSSREGSSSRNETRGRDRS